MSPSLLISNHRNTARPKKIKVEHKMSMLDEKLDLESIYIHPICFLEIEM